MIDIPGRTFPVTRYYLEDAVEFTGYFCDEKSEFAAKLERTGRDGKGKKGSRGGTRGLRGGVGDVLDSLRDVETEKLAKLKGGWRGVEIILMQQHGVCPTWIPKY